MAIQTNINTQRAEHPARAIQAWNRRIGKTVVYILLVLLSIIFAGPLLWMLSTSLKSLADVSVFPPIIFPNPPLWSNFVTALTQVPVFQFMGNSVAYCILALIGDLLSSSLVAYAFAHVRFRYREIVFVCVLATMMVPYEILIIPQFLTFRSLGWIDTYLPLIVPTFFGSPYLIFLLRQAFRSLPRELIEAAKLDGANHLTIWWRIVLPLSKPALAAVAIFSFIFHWNDLTGPLIYLNTNEKYPISLGLTQYTASLGQTQWNMLMAASLVAIIPCIVVFFFSQRYMVQGIVVARVKTDERG
ncbi:carbohydrate ABC transporter permease [Ktedonospora formicarum]|uniref:Sugar ABC transporter permease n=1 Tax=Ktedonospora formicarum TaxID=2778364 RepID=A0A8J3MQP3_9CHLR|nr:carbohydrate ABC transporter permease [Ktedonospora formicarum]GHO42986.1 sugar ABC transporter permease [Ktedonospora formicarum]